MSILKYVQVHRASELPNPEGSLSKTMSAASICCANEELRMVQEAAAKPKKRGTYKKLSEEMKAKIGKFACENGVAAAVRKFSKDLEKPLNESTIRGIKQRYLVEVSRKRKAEEDIVIERLPERKRGRPLLLGTELDAKVQAYLHTLRENGGSVGTAIVRAAARGIVQKVNRGMLAEFGGPITLTKAWVQSLLSRMGFVKRRGTTKAKVSVEKFEIVKKSYLDDIASTVFMEEIPSDLIFNWDQTGLNIIPTSSWTMEKKGSRRVELAGLNDKRQITAVFCGSLNGVFLPPQIIYQGKTQRCHPVFKFPQNWNVTHSPNHWANEDTTLEYLQKIIIPYIQQMRTELSLSENHPALAIFDMFKAHLTDPVTKILEENSILFVTVPPNCTDRLQPLDISLNKSVKDFLRKMFQEWYADQVMSQLDDDPGCTIQPISLTGAAVKSKTASWLVQMFDYVESNPHLIVNSFLEAGITQAIDHCCHD